MTGFSTAATNKRSMRKIWKTLRLRHLGLGFFWACSMLTFRSTLLLPSGIESPENQSFVVITSFAINAAVIIGLSALRESNQKLFQRIPSWPFVVSIIIGLILLSSSCFLFPASPLFPTIAGAILAGAGYGYFWGSWAEIYGAMHPSRTSFYLPVAFLVTTVVFLLVSFAHESLGIPILALMIPLPIASYMCLARCKRFDGLEPAHDNSQKTYLRAFGSLWGLILASLVLSCLFGFTWEIAVFSAASVNEAHQLPLGLNLVVALGLVAFVLFGHTRINLTLAYQVIIPTIIVAYCIMPLLWESEPVLINAIVSASYGLFDVVIWYMAVSTAYDFSISGFIVGGLIRVVSIISRLLGIGIGFIVMMIPGYPSTIIVGISLGALYLLAMMYLAFRNRRTSRSILGSGIEAVPLSPEDRGQIPAEEPSGVSDKPLDDGKGNLDENGALSQDEKRSILYQKIAEEYGLTRRETEVLPYLAKGRSAKVIAQALFVSESTIRTHTRRILEKTALHSKQDLIDLIDGSSL